MSLSVRIYKSGRIAKGLIFAHRKFASRKYDLFIYLENSFNEDGGMSKYCSYGLGKNEYQYREMTCQEFKTLNIDLNQKIHLNGIVFTLDVLIYDSKKKSREIKLTKILKNI